MAKVIGGQSLPNMPWEERPEGCKDVMWRYSANPIIKRDATSISNSIFNSAVVPFENGYAGVFRCDDKCIRMNIFVGFSDNGLDWNISDEPIHFEAAPGCDPVVTDFEYRYDPRVCKIEDKYFITWCNGYHGPTIGIGYTYDFKTFYQCENAFLPYNRNGVMFPRKFNDKYLLMSRPSDTGHTPFGDIFVSESPDLVYWGKHRFMMKPSAFDKSAWQCMKIGPGPVPIETDEGWILFYHGVIHTCNGYVYSFGAAILDREDPSKVLYRCAPYLIHPTTPYECTGDVPNVCFPCASLCDADTGRIAVYYGAADTVTALAFTTVDELIPWIKANAIKE